MANTTWINMIQNLSQYFRGRILHLWIETGGPELVQLVPFRCETPKLNNFFVFVVGCGEQTPCALYCVMLCIAGGREYPYIV